jgi:Effector Associated Constant Component 1
MEREDTERVELTVSDPSQLGPLQSYLKWAAPAAVGLSRIGGAPGTGEQGALDVLVLLASSTGVVAAIKVLPEFIKARKTGLSITATVKGKPLKITATNVDEVIPILERILDA